MYDGMLWVLGGMSVGGHLVAVRNDQILARFARQNDKSGACWMQYEVLEG